MDRVGASGESIYWIGPAAENGLRGLHEALGKLSRAEMAISSLTPGEAAERARADRPAIAILTGPLQNAAELSSIRQVRAHSPQTVFVSLAGPLPAAEGEHIPQPDIVLPHGDSPDELALAIAGILRLSTRFEKVYEENRRLRMANHVDPSTGLLSRRGLLVRLEAEFNRASRSGEPLGCLMACPALIETDASALPEEDWARLMRDCASAIDSGMRDCDILGRFDDHSFLMILPNTSSAGVATLTRRLRALIEARPIFLSQGAAWATARIGRASTSDAGISAPERLLKAAETGASLDEKDSMREGGVAHSLELVSPGATRRTRALMYCSAELRPALAEMLSPQTWDVSVALSLDGFLERLTADSPDAVIVEDRELAVLPPAERRRTSQLARSAGAAFLWIANRTPSAEDFEGDFPDDWMSAEQARETLPFRLERICELRRLREDMRENDAQLRHAKQMAEESERLRALGQIAGGVAHDFNNVLSAILGRTQLLKTRVTSQTDFNDLEIIEKAALDGAETVRRIQSYTRRGDGARYRQLDLASLLNDCLLMTRPRWKDEAERRGNAYHIEFEADEFLWVRGHPSELREIFTNLLLNALDAMPDGGMLRIAAHAEDGKAQVAVSDTGVGIDSKDVERIFDPFFTTKKEHGTGLGLSVAQGIVTRHGGMIEVDSAPGQGTTFLVTLPLQKDEGLELEAASPVSLSAREQPRVPLRILVVDDEPTVREILEDLLRECGHEVHATASATEALTRLSSDGAYDVLFTDLGMPDVSGWELARQARSVSPLISIVLVSGWATELDDAALVENGVDHAIPKPVALEDLFRILRQIEDKLLKESLGVGARHRE